MLGLSGQGIEEKAKVTLHNFTNERKDVGKLVDKAKGVLVFPSVVKAGIGFGGEYGEGALFTQSLPPTKFKKIDIEKASGFYNLLSVSFGWQLGAQRRSIIMLFMTDDALKQFGKILGWKVGVDASVTVLNLDAGLNLDTNELTSPVVAFVYDRAGLMYNATLEGTK